MKNAMQLKAFVKNIAKEKNISAQIILQNYMMERLLERISLSNYKEHFILKGGFLLAAMVGLDTRATMDMDATIKGLPVTKESIAEMFMEICEIEIDDAISFSFNDISDIREDDEYSGFRVTLTGNYSPMAVPMKIDITTGDKITPREIVYKFNLMFEDRQIDILAYPLETILAEKLETIISRSDQNTRPRDFYDIYILKKLQNDNINFKVLKDAFTATATKRGTIHIMERYAEILEVVENSGIMVSQWTRYQNEFDYAKSIEFKDTCDAAKAMLDKI